MYRDIVQGDFPLALAPRDSGRSVWQLRDHPVEDETMNKPRAISGLLLALNSMVRRHDGADL